MKKILFAILALIFSGEVFAQAGGFPSRPKFQSATVGEGVSIGGNFTSYTSSVTPKSFLTGLSTNAVDNKYAVFTSKAPGGFGLYLMDDALSSYVSVLSADRVGMVSSALTLTGTTINAVGNLQESGVDVATYVSGSYTATAVGCTTSPTYTVQYTKIADVVALTIPGTGCTSNSTAFSLTGAPAAIRPPSDSTKRQFSVDCSNATAVTACSVYMDSAGALIYQIAQNSAGFTASGVKGTGNGGAYTYLMR